MEHQVNESIGDQQPNLEQILKYMLRGFQADDILYIEDAGFSLQAAPDRKSRVRKIFPMKRRWSSTWRRRR